MDQYLWQYVFTIVIPDEQFSIIRITNQPLDNTNSSHKLKEWQVLKIKLYYQVLEAVLGIHSCDCKNQSSDVRIHVSDTNNIWLAYWRVYISI